MIKRTNIEQEFFLCIRIEWFSVKLPNIMWWNAVCVQVLGSEFGGAGYINFPSLDFETAAIAIDCRRHSHSNDMKNDIIVFKPNIHSATIPKFSEVELFFGIFVSGNRFVELKNFYDLLFISNLNWNRSIRFGFFSLDNNGWSIHYY